MQPNIASKLQKVPNMLFSFIVQWHKVSCDIHFDDLFRDIGFIHHTHDGNEKQESLDERKKPNATNVRWQTLSNGHDCTGNRCFYKWLVSFVAR